MAWNPLKRAGTTAQLPQELRAHLPAGERPIASVPADDAGTSWLVITSAGLYALGPFPQGTPASATWDSITHAAWDAEQRTYTITIVGRPEPWAIHIPATVETTHNGTWQSTEVDERAFATALRQHIERAIVHYARHTLSNGTRFTATVRRRPDGTLYTTSEPPLDDPALTGVEEEATAHLRTTAAAAGLTLP